MTTEFETCPGCTKKGLYLAQGHPFKGDGTKCCRHCNVVVIPDARVIDMLVGKKSTRAIQQPGSDMWIIYFSWGQTHREGTKEEIETYIHRVITNILD